MQRKNPPKTFISLFRKARASSDEDTSFGIFWKKLNKKNQTLVFQDWSL